MHVAVVCTSHYCLSAHSLIKGYCKKKNKQPSAVGINEVYSICEVKNLPLSPQSVHRQQQLQHQEFQRQMEERLELLQRQQPFPSADMGLGLVPDSDYLEVARARSESSDHSSPNVTPRASNHSNMSMSEIGSSANEHEDGGKC